jgi:hypothetical protein
MLSAPTAVSGEAAVEQSAAASGFGGADVAVAPPSDAADMVRIAGSRAFRLVDGTWIDTAFDPDSMTTLKVAFAGEDYFALAASRPDLAAAFALGDRVIVLVGGVAYEVVASGETGDPITIPPAPAPRAEEQAPAPDQPVVGEPAPERSPSGFSLPCPASAMLLGVVAVSWGTRRRG